MDQEKVEKAYEKIEKSINELSVHLDVIEDLVKLNLINGLLDDYIANEEHEEKMDTKIRFQLSGREIKVEEIAESVKLACRKKYPHEKIKSLEIYVKPEENMVYYVVDGKVEDDYKIPM